MPAQASTKREYVTNAFILGSGVGIAMGIYLEIVQRSFISVVTCLPNQGCRALSMTQNESLNPCHQNHQVGFSWHTFHPAMFPAFAESPPSSTITTLRSRKVLSKLHHQLTCRYTSFFIFNKK